MLEKNWDHIFKSKYLIPQKRLIVMIYPNDSDSKNIESWLTNDKNKI